MVSVRALDKAPAGTPMAVSLRSTRELPTANWRTFRPSFLTRPSPCNLDCPAGTDVRTFLALAADGDVEAAWQTIIRHNPLPAICGRVCYHPCEQDCNRLALDEAVAIHAIERAIGDAARHFRFEPEATVLAPARRVGVIGAGPAGLSCAYHLARRGHRVTVMDAMAEPGGMLRYGIPAYHLPRFVLDAEVERLRRMGVRLVGHARIGVNVGPEDLGEYAALFMAVGAQRSRRANVPGEELRGVRSGLGFLREVNANGTATLAGRVLIIGGGNTALDAARVALRLGAEPTIVYRRTREDMPAHPDEIAQAQAEGIEFVFSAAPIRFLARGGRVVGAELQRMRPGAPDATGRPRPEPIPGSTFELAADHVLTAVGEEADVEALSAFVDATGGRLRADGWGRTERPPIFAGGDAATGAGTVVAAIGSGRLAAEAIDAYLNGRDPVEDGRAARVGRQDLNLHYFRPASRIHPALLRRERAVRTFSEVVSGLSWEQAVAEARRCMSCGACTTCDNCLVFCPDAAVRRNPETGLYDVDLGHCKGCGICAAECPRGAIVLVPEEQR